MSPRLTKLFLFYSLGGKTKPQYTRFQISAAYRKRCIQAGAVL